MSLIGLFSWLRSLCPSFGRIFSGTMNSFLTWPTRGLSLLPLLVLLRSTLPLLLRPPQASMLPFSPLLSASPTSLSSSQMSSLPMVHSPSASPPGPPPPVDLPWISGFCENLLSGSLHGEDDIVRCFMSSWSSPLHMGWKKQGGWRPCKNYRRLNTVTVPDRYPLPNIADFTPQILFWFYSFLQTRPPEGLLPGFHGL